MHSHMLVAVSKARVIRAQVQVGSHVGGSPAASLAELSPDVAMRFVMAFAAFSHGGYQYDDFKATENNYLLERLNGEGLSEDTDPAVYALRWQVSRDDCARRPESQIYPLLPRLGASDTLFA